MHSLSETAGRAELSGCVLHIAYLAIDERRKECFIWNRAVAADHFVPIRFIEIVCLGSARCDRAGLRFHSQFCRPFETDK